MNFKSFEKADRKILSAAALMLLLSLLLLWQDGWIYRLVESRKSDLEQIGEVTKSNNDVRRRYEVALSWIPLYKKNEIYQGDSIFTGANSTAIIKTKSGQEISIAPNSLVVINQKKDSISLDIGFGSVEGKVLNGKKFVISSNNNITELAGNNAVVKVDAGEGNKLVLNVISGELKIKSPTGDKILKVDDSTEISPDGQLSDPLRPAIQLLSPLVNQKFKIPDDQAVIFKWATQKKFIRMKIKIGADPEFKNILVDSRTDDTTYAAYNLPRDIDLYWQILAESGTSVQSKFALVGNRAPVPIFPKPGYQFYFDPFLAPPLAGEMVELTWQPGSISTLYEVQLANDNLITKNIRSFKTRETKLPIGLIPEGAYYWRVRSLDFANQKWSDPSFFKVGPEPTRILAPPLPQLAENIFLIDTKIHNESVNVIHHLRKRGAQKYIARYPQLRWSSVVGADRYVIEVSRNKNFSDKIIAETIPHTYYTWKNIELGKYYWRAKALSENYKDGLYSQTQELKISLSPPTALSQTSIIDEVPDEILLQAPPPPLKLKWNPTVFTTGYEIEFSVTSDFVHPTKIITDRSESLVIVERPGTYYWRIRSLDLFQLPISPFSQANVLEFQRIYKDPMNNRNLMAVYPRQQDSIILVGREKSEVDFKWTKPYKDAKYRIELSYEPTFNVVFFSTLTTNNFYRYSETFQSQVIYWRIRAEKLEGNSDWTGANRFLVSYENTPFNFEQSDLMFEARLQAKERQQQLLAAQSRRLAQLRTPASALELQLDSPQLIDPPRNFTIDSNLNPALSTKKLATMPFEKFFAQVRGYPTIRWQKVPAAERYVFEISRDPQFTKTVSKTPCWDPFFTWDTVRPGRFYYRVQAFNDRYTRSNFSAPHAFDVTVEAPTPTSADNYVEVFDEPRDMWQPPSPFNLSWTPVVFARGYEVEFSEDKTFNLTKVFKTQDTTTEFHVSKSGLYYWRVRPINENGIGIGPFSNIRSLEVIQTNRSPASVNGFAGLFPKDRTMLFIGKGLMNLAFHWVSPEPRNAYQLEISTTASFDKISASTQSRTGQAIVRQDLPEGKLYWRVRDSKSVSAVNEFYLRREREPYVEETKASVLH